MSEVDNEQSPHSYSLINTLVSRTWTLLRARHIRPNDVSMAQASGPQGQGTGKGEGVRDRRYHRHVF